ncbi:MAG: hypothetical protein ACTHNW_04790 [Mucilaginibacter sp.]
MAEHNTGGGSATNSGIDYQQRVAACFQIFLYTQFEISQLLNEDFALTIKSMHFETSDAVDDLKLLCNNGHSLYIQAKRSVSFSDLPGSEFMKALNQFIEQYQTGGTNDYFVLATSDDSSRRVTGELRKILTNMRLNDTSFKLNPLNKSEKEVYDKFKAAFLLKTGLDRNSFVNFAKRLYVEVMDVKEGKSLEKSAKLLLVGLMQNPDLVWALLIKNSLAYSANRSSVNQKALVGILTNYKKRKGEAIDKDEMETFLRDSITLTGEYSCNKEVLVFEMKEGDKNAISEFQRFSSTCSKWLRFSDNQVKFSDDSEPLNLVYRGSSIVGLNRFIEKDPGALGDKVLVLHESPGIDRSGQEECIKLHSEYLDQLSKENLNLGNCLHCGKPVGSEENLLIEIDDEDTQSAVGACHWNCRRPMDRVMGTARMEREDNSPFLEEFDMKEWVSLLLRGGIMASGLTPALQGRAQIAWSGFPLANDGDYCIKFQLEDGTKRFAFHRGYIERFSQSQAIRQADRFRKQMVKQNDEDDPIGYTIKNMAYGIYSKLLIGMEPDDEFVAITGVSVVRYSRQEAKLHETGRMYYAPLCYMGNKHNNIVLVISDMVPLISDPLKIDSLVRSWNNAGIDVADWKLCTLRSDHEVDLLFARLFEDGMLPILDPVLDQNMRLVNGYPIRPAPEIIADYSNLT